MNTPTGGSQTSHDERPDTRLPNGQEATYFNIVAPILQERLTALEREQRLSTPDYTPPFESATQPMSARDQCDGLWASLPEETLEKERKSIPCAWYQLYKAFAMLQLLMSKAEKGGLWSDNSVLFSDGSNTDKAVSHSYWREASDSSCRLLEIIGVTKSEMREHLQNIERDVFWEVERKHLLPIVEAEDQKCHAAMAAEARQAALENPSVPQPTTQQTAPRPTTPQALKARQPGKVGNTVKPKAIQQRTRINKAQSKTTTARENTASRAARYVLENSTSSDPVMGNSFASTTATGKPSKITYGLNAQDIINNNKRSLRNQTKSQTKQALASTRIIDGRVSTRKQRQRAR